MKAETLPAADLPSQLQLLYDQVPATCCATSGECCALSETEFEQGYATMFPLYSAEYLHIAAHVRQHFAPERREALFAFTEERPRRCPFLGKDQGCTIYPVRPLICRTYAVMTPQRIERALEQYREVLPETWLKGFARRESSMLCPRVQVTQPAKLEGHIYNLITSYYERALRQLHSSLELGDPQRRQALQAAGHREWPLTWTWGGFNALCAAPIAWVRTHFAGYAKKAELMDIV